MRTGLSTDAAKVLVVDNPPMDFAAGQKVQLTEEVDDLPAGTVGIVVGYYARELPTYVVAFPESRVRQLLPVLLERVRTPPA